MRNNVVLPHLAAARAAEQAEQLAFVDLQGNIVDGNEVTKLLGDTFDVDVRHRLRIFPGRHYLRAGVGYHRWFIGAGAVYTRGSTH
jgi:hypothetical protein